MRSSKCQQCGFVGFGSATCKGCGASLEGANHNYKWTPDGGSLKKGLAILGLVLGILGFFTAGLIIIGAVVGTIVSAKAMRLARDNPWEYGGKSLAIAGLVLNVTSISMAVPMLIIAAIAIPNLLAARMQANEGSSLYTMRTLYSAQMTYYANQGSYGTMQDLVDSHLVDPKLSTGVKNGYKFSVELTPGSRTIPEGFEITAVPETYRSSGMRSFYTDDTGIIRGGNTFGGPATRSDPPLPPRDEPGRHISGRQD